MAGKRKATSHGKCSGGKKRAREPTSLCELPTEILDLIISLVIPDPTQLNHGADRLSGSSLFEWSILRTCKRLRQVSLKLLQSFFWIRIHLPSRQSYDDFRESLPELPLLRIKQQQHVSMAPTIRLSWTWDLSSIIVLPPEVSCDSSEEQFECTLPFNFASLIRICGYISTRSSGIITELIVKCIQVSAQAETRINELLIPALSTLRTVDSFRFECNANEWPCSRVRKDICGRDWNLSKRAERALTILHTASALEETGHVDAADMLLLSSAWLSEQAQQWLPDPKSWVMGEENDEDANIYYMCYPARNSKGNQFRQSLLQIETRACRSLGRLVRKFDWNWYLTYQSLFGIALDRFIRGYHFTWFGASTTELAELHYGCAIVYGMLSRRRWQHEPPAHSEWWFEFPYSGLDFASYQVPYDIPDDGYNQVNRRSSSVCTKKGRDDFTAPLQKSVKDENEDDDFLGAVELAFACALNPRNLEYGEAYAALTRRTSAARLRRVEKRCRSNFVLLESSPVNKTESRALIWAGDYNTIAWWAGVWAVPQWYALAQKGLKINPTVEDWVASNLSSRERKLFIRQGLEYANEGLETGSEVDSDF